MGSSECEQGLPARPPGGVWLGQCVETENGSFSLCPAPQGGPCAQSLHVPQLGASTSEGGECCCRVPCAPSGPCGWVLWTQPHVMGHRAKIGAFSFLLLAMSRGVRDRYAIKWLFNNANDNNNNKNNNNNHNTIVAAHAMKSLWHT